MRIYHGGDLVKKGYYFDWLNRKLIRLQEDGILEGMPRQIFWSLNTIELISLVLLIATIYVIFIPFVGIAVVAWVLLIHILVFIAQKVICKMLRRLCDAEHWICDLTNRVCKQCGKECEDDVAMLVKGFVLSLFLLTGILIGRYLLQ